MHDIVIVTGENAVTKKERYIHTYLTVVISNIGEVVAMVPVMASIVLTPVCDINESVLVDVKHGIIILIVQVIVEAREVVVSCR